MTEAVLKIAHVSQVIPQRDCTIACVPLACCSSPTGASALGPLLPVEGDSLRSMRGPSQPLVVPANWGDNAQQLLRGLQRDAASSGLLRVKANEAIFQAALRVLRDGRQECPYSAELAFQEFTVSVAFAQHLREPARSLNAHVQLREHVQQGGEVNGKIAEAILKQFSSINAGVPATLLVPLCKAWNGASGGIELSGPSQAQLVREVEKVILNIVPGSSISQPLPMLLILAGETRFLERYFQNLECIYPPMQGPVVDWPWSWPTPPKKLLRMAGVLRAVGYARIADGLLLNTMADRAELVAVAQGAGAWRPCFKRLLGKRNELIEQKRLHLYGAPARFRGTDLGTRACSGGTLSLEKKLKTLADSVAKGKVTRIVDIVATLFDRSEAAVAIKTLVNEGEINQLISVSVQVFQRIFELQMMEKFRVEESIQLTKVLIERFTGHKMGREKVLSALSKGAENAAVRLGPDRNRSLTLAQNLMILHLREHAPDLAEFKLLQVPPTSPAEAETQIAGALCLAAKEERAGPAWELAGSKLEDCGVLSDETWQQFVALSAKFRDTKPIESIVANRKRHNIALNVGRFLSEVHALALKTGSCKLLTDLASAAKHDQVSLPALNADGWNPLTENLTLEMQVRQVEIWAEKGLLSVIKPPLADLISPVIRFKHYDDALRLLQHVLDMQPGAEGPLFRRVFSVFYGLQFYAQGAAFVVQHQARIPSDALSYGVELVRKSGKLDESLAICDRERKRSHSAVNKEHFEIVRLYTLYALRDPRHKQEIEIAQFDRYGPHGTRFICLKAYCDLIPPTEKADTIKLLQASLVGRTNPSAIMDIERAIELLGWVYS